MIRLDRSQSFNIGTSGWSYASWRGRFFPKEVMAKHHLAYYASQFISAEINSVFYRTPSLETVRSWREQTPDDFVFAWKASMNSFQFAWTTARYEKRSVCRSNG